MDAVKYLKERKRMCDSYNNMCDGCGFGKVPKCNHTEEDNPEKAVEIVEKWSAEHPMKTRQSDDLISRRTIKSLIEVIRDCWAISPYVSANDMKLYSKVFNVVLNEISNCPTAFDKEKVIEELNEKADYARNRWLNSTKEGQTKYWEGKENGIREAIEIVEKGGIE